ncbi:carboxynorspermidine decarboxylase [Dysgonomonas sp. GY617]|uniref:carboxynorspermidine decarboxylase n=1 Tax=Dysgonomonas sp. GY617 TaxID=2780420 RepID=UPI0018839E0F|nr:carboxynorspermidine decarboxylase [Dysgonomonas sp. GY617]MBF0577516.1 carboxynorspermidine decarboxylase [Dysgonomonas sp. GY617]
MIEIHKVPSPCFVMEEELLRKNLSLIKSVKDRTGVNIILAFKAFAMWKSFPIIREYIPYSTASSVFEAQLAYEEMKSPAHTFSPAYTNENFPTFLKYSNHITFNSLTQFERFYPQVEADGNKVSCGIRINPEYSEVETDLYNPCAPGSRFGVTPEALGDCLPEGVEGLHFHTLCESSSYDLEKTLNVVTAKFDKWLKQAKWLNMGGGHLMTRDDYDVEHLVKLLLALKEKYPHLEIIMEPGSAFAWQTGVLVSTVIDVVENQGIKTAILDVSFACHMPDCLEMPYKPKIRGAYHDPVEGKPTYRMGGNSCLSGDFMGDWSFDEPLAIGDKIVFEDMIHYTIVKTTMFNGISHPALALWHQDNKLEIYKEFDYTDYKNRMS